MLWAKARLRRDATRLGVVIHLLKSAHARSPNGEKISDYSGGRYEDFARLCVKSMTRCQPYKMLILYTNGRRIIVAFATIVLQCKDLRNPEAGLMETLINCPRVTIEENASDKCERMILWQFRWHRHGATTYRKRKEHYIQRHRAVSPLRLK